MSVDASVDADALARVLSVLSDDRDAAPDAGVPGVRGTDMRKGMDGLAVLVQQVLAQDPHSGAVFAFRGKRGDLVKLLWYDGQGLCLFSKRIDRGHFVWPDGRPVSLTCRRAAVDAAGGHRLAASRAHMADPPGGVKTTGLRRFCSYRASVIRY